MATTPQMNTFVTLAEQIALLNTNSTEIITKMNDIVTSDSSVVNVTQTDSTGKEHTYSMPTVGKLQADITELNNNVKRLAGMNDNNVHIMNGKSTKKIYLSDLNREPNQIDNITSVSTFGQTNNWFFESLMNPMLSVNFDLTSKVGNDVDGVISRRYIVNFEKVGDTYTVNGESSRQDFITRFVNKDGINLKDFISWYTNPTNIGVIQNLTPSYDEQFFNFEYQEISDYGVFSVMQQETDTINNKLWYHIYPYKYVTSTGAEKTLKIGDELMLNKQDSVTRYQILETSVASSDFRVRVERIEGFDPIPTGTNVLRYYGDPIVNKTVKVSVGFGEYLVIFMKPTNSKNRIKGSLWSQGTGLYTNDLKLDSDANVTMSQFYLDSVYDYGNLIRDMIKKQIPSTSGITPFAPNLITDNFKVVQINQHLTDTSDTKKLNDLNSQKNTLQTKLDQINNAIIQKNQDLSVKKYSSISDRDKDVSELSQLVKDQQTYTTNYYSITTQIKSMADSINSVEPLFRVRGFWDMPLAQKQGGFRDQEVIQFRVQYRYSAKNGTENQTQGYTILSADNTTKTGYFSNWNEFKSDIRKRSYSDITGQWTWEIENVSDADTPNINQLDIPISADEKIEIRATSISEVGYPDSILESVWSNILTVTFPDNLSSIINSNQFVLQQAQQDNITTGFELTLDSKGLTKHVQDAYYNNESYIAHLDDKIATNYKDLQGTTYNLRQYLDFLTNKIAKLEGIIYSAKGILKVTVFNGSDEIEVQNNSETTLSVVLQNYGVSKDGITYDNKISKISDYYIRIKNLSSATGLKFLVNDTYAYDTNISNVVRHNSASNLVSLVDINNNLVMQGENQYIYFCDTNNNEDLYLGSVSGDTRADSGMLIPALTSKTQNVGLSAGYVNSNKTFSNTYPITGRLIEAKNSNGKTNVNAGINEWFVATTTSSNLTMATTVAPMVKTINDLIPPNNTSVEITNEQDIIIPINIYWLFNTSLAAGSVPAPLSSVILANEMFFEHTKSLRIRLHPTALPAAFDFVVNFNIQNKKI